MLAAGRFAADTRAPTHYVRIEVSTRATRTKDTRRRLIDEATRAFADRGIYAASLIDITRRARQANRAALHYHFGSREGILHAVLEQHVGFLARREGELLEVARTRPQDDVESVVEAIVRPASELAESGWRGRCFLVILAELIQEDPKALQPEISDVLARTGGPAVYELLASRLPSMSDEIRAERFALITGFILRAVADRARGRRRRARPQLDREDFVMNLVRMASSAVSVPFDRA